MTRITIILICIIINSCQKVNFGEWNIYEVKEGKSLFSPISRSSVKVVDETFFYVSFVFYDNCKYDFKGDLDQLDWNKLTVFSFDAFCNNCDNILIGWRYRVDLGKIELCFYRNDKKGSWIIGDERYFLETNKKGDAFLSISKNGKIVCEFENGKSDTFKRSTSIKNVHFLETPYFGGKDNSEGGYGGKAPKKMNIKIKSNVSH